MDNDDYLQGWGQDGVNYSIDIVFCIDVTGSMTPYIEQVKEKVVNFKDELLQAMKELWKQCTGGIRTKVVAFRDEKIGEKKEVSPFYTMPEQENEFRAFVNGLKAQGGRNTSKSVYVALIEAINSDWVKEGAKRRWVTVLFTDGSAYSEKINELVDIWNGLDYYYKRLVIFAPDHPTWTDFAGQAQNTILLPIQGWRRFVGTRHGNYNRFYLMGLG